MFVGKEGGNPLFSFDIHICKTAVISSNKHSFLKTIYGVYFVTHFFKMTLISMRPYMVSSVWYTVLKMAPCEKYSTVCTIYYGYTIHYVLYTMHYILRLHYTLCTIHYVLYTMYYGYTIHYALYTTVTLYALFIKKLIYKFMLYI